MKQLKLQKVLHKLGFSINLYMALNSAASIIDCQLTDALTLRR